MFSDLITLNGSLPRDHQRTTISLGNLGTAETINHMREAATLGKRNFKVRELAGKIIREHCSNKDFLCYAKSIFEYCRDQIYYVFDPQGVELVEKPWKVLESGIADCDSIVPLLASMLESIGLQCRYVTIKADVQRPNDYSHVFLECHVPRHGWIPMDATMPDKPFGWGPDKKWPRKTWPASNDEPEDHGGDAMLEKVKSVENGASMQGYAALGYLNEVATQYDSDQVPGISETVGVHQGNPWSFQQQAAAITATPEQLELQPLQGRPGPVGAPTPDFFIHDDAATVLRDKAAQMNLENAPQISVEPKAAVPKWMLWLLVGAGAYMLLRKK
jgi:hypothetical protein